MKLILYTTHCSKCRVLEAALKQKGVPYEVCEDVNEMLRLGMTSAPALMVDDKLLSYEEAMKYIMEGI